jgi:glutamine amidotransferase
MCQLFALSADHPVRVNPLLGEFFSHSDVHAHGWGFASFGPDITHIEKEPIRAAESAYLRQILNYPLMATTAFAHIRFATAGEVSEANCHPFSAPDEGGRRWTLIHNGTIIRGELLEPYRSVQLGQTDSERILYALLDRINTAMQTQGCILDVRARRAIVNELLCALAPENYLNVIVFDGEQLYVFPADRYEEDTSGQLAAIWRRPAETVGGHLFATVPLDEKPWELMPLGRLATYAQGQFISS